MNASFVIVITFCLAVQEIMTTDKYLVMKNLILPDCDA
jgi:hypothetical protein